MRDETSNKEIWVTTPIVSETIPSKTSNKEIWTETPTIPESFPSKYRFIQIWKALIDLLKNLMTNPARAMEFPLWIFITLFLLTLTIFSLIHSSLVIFTSNFASYELNTFSTGVIRLFSSTIVAVIIALPGVVFMWVITPQLTFKSTFKRFLFYYETVILFSLLGEVFFCKFIIESSMKIQPIIIIFAGTIAIHLLQNALGQEHNIRITRVLIVFILTFSYLQAFMIVDSMIPYYLQDNIDSPITKLIRGFFKILFD